MSATGCCARTPPLCRPVTPKDDEFQYLEKNRAVFEDEIPRTMRSNGSKKTGQCLGTTRSLGGVGEEVDWGCGGVQVMFFRDAGEVMYYGDESVEGNVRRMSMLGELEKEVAAVLECWAKAKGKLMAMSSDSSGYGYSSADSMVGNSNPKNRSYTTRGAL